MKKVILITYSLITSPSLLGMEYSFLNEPERALREYLRQDDLEQLVHLLNNSNVNTPNKFNQTPLHLAALFGSVRSVLLCLSLGADPSVINGTRKTPCDLAKNTYITQLLRLSPTNTDHKDLASILHGLQHPDSFSKETINTCVPIGGATPLMYAALAYQSGNVRILLENGANPLLQTPQNITVFDMLQSLKNDPEHGKNYALIWHMCSGNVLRRILVLQKKMVAEHCTPLFPPEIWFMIVSWIIGSDALLLLPSHKDYMPGN